MFSDLVKFVKILYNSNDFVPLNVPHVSENGKKYVNECIETNFVSSVGIFVNQFEDVTDQNCGAKYDGYCSSFSKNVNSK